MNRQVPFFLFPLFFLFLNGISLATMVNIDDKGEVDVEVHEVDNNKTITSEPSMIWTRLPVIQNNEMEAEPMYCPSYIGLSPKHRFQYLSWLQDVSQPTNLSYVFLYYYGLERHLLYGNFDLALEETMRLLEFHPHISFFSYAKPALLAACAYRKKPEVIDKYPVLLEHPSNEALVVRKMATRTLTAKNLIDLSGHVGFYGRKHLPQYSQLFHSIVQKKLDEHQDTHGDILQNLDLSEIPKEDVYFFANMSLKEKCHAIEFPDIINYAQQQSLC